jgi:hypothetical protein
VPVIGAKDLGIMSHIPDMQMLDSGYVAVGWLHPDHPFPQGNVAPEFLAKLKEFAKRSRQSAVALGSGAACGIHTCEFCGNAHGIANFGVPTGDRLFYSPEMITHYVEEHHYAPPPEFIVATMTSPLPGTRAYVDCVAPILKRQKALSRLDTVSIELERHVALVLFEFLTRLSDAETFWAEERADQVAIWTLLGRLESLLVEPFDPNYIVDPENWTTP